MLGRLALGFAALLLVPHALVPRALEAQAANLPAGLPLRVALDHRYSMRRGTQLQGHLTSAVYLVDHIVLPVDTPVYGVVLGRHAVEHRIRVNALLDGDFTPLSEPEIVFERMQLPDGSQVEFSAPATERNAVVVRMTGAARDLTLLGRLKTEFNARRHEAMGTYLGRGKSERLRQYLYRMMPYHPQNLWTGEQFDAELSQPLEVPQAPGSAAPLPMVEFGKGKPTGVIEARLIRSLSSANCPVGMAVDAILSKPLFDQQHEHILLPEGTALAGSIVESSPAGLFARGGHLRFSFRKIQLAEKTSTVRGTMVAAEGSRGDNLAIDSEGGARPATPNRALGTLTLAVLAAGSHGDGEDRGAAPLRSAVVSNGFGIAARLASVATGNRDVAAGFAYYALAKNVYRRWIAKGKEVSFPKNTRIEIDLSDR